ncbi:hypothetical protein Tco_0712952 [Tanacetum coccineum]
MSFDPLLPLFVEVKKDDRRIVERKKLTMPRLPLDVCSPSFRAPRDRSYEIIATKQVPKVDDVSLVDGVFDGAFGGDGEEDFVIGEGVVVESSSLEMLTKSYLGNVAGSREEDGQLQRKSGEHSKNYVTPVWTSSSPMPLRAIVAQLPEINMLKGSTQRLSEIHSVCNEMFEYKSS